MEWYVGDMSEPAILVKKLRLCSEIWTTLGLKVRSVDEREQGLLLRGLQPLRLESEVLAVVLPSLSARWLSLRPRDCFECELDPVVWVVAFNLERVGIGGAGIGGSGRGAGGDGRGGA